MVIGTWQRDAGGDAMTETQKESGIEIFYGGGQKFPPPPEFAARANATAELYDIARRDVVAYWESAIFFALGGGTKFSPATSMPLDWVNPKLCR